MKADLKSSGNAALAAQPQHEGELGASLCPQPSPELVAGANNFVLMLDRLYEIGDETYFRHGDDEDGRDYRLMCFEAETAILANLLGSGQDVRQGFLRALIDYLTHSMGGILPSDDWNGQKALATTAAAFVDRQNMEVCNG